MIHCLKKTRPSTGYRCSPTLILLACLFFHTSANAAGIPGVGELPKIPAFLPMVSSVPATSAMPIDGTWIVEPLGKKVRIEKGRTYAIDGWLHMFVLDIKPGMVVSRDIKPTGPGKYSGYDLPWLSNFTMQVNASGGLAVSIQTPLVPANFNLLPVQLDNQAWFNQEMQAAGLQPATAPSAAPAYQFTQPPGYGGGQPQPGYGAPAPNPPSYGGGQPGYTTPQQPGYGGQPGAGYGNPQTQQPGYSAPAPGSPSYGGDQPADDLAPGETAGCIRGVNC